MPKVELTEELKADLKRKMKINKERHRRSNKFKGSASKKKGSKK